jgi:quinol monooxygenase YgiN
MIRRIVKMTFREGTEETFLAVFEANKEKIRAFEGCKHLELWRQLNGDAVFMTYSIWESEAHLDKYRYSSLFRETWEQTKILFEKPAEALSLEQVAFLP